MSIKARLSPAARFNLEGLLLSQLNALRSLRAVHLQGLSQADFSRQTLLQDADDAIQHAGAHEIEAGVSSLEIEAAAEIRSALQRIHGDTYGRCVECEDAIPFDRLRLEPQALRCVDCESVHERRGLI